ncbi:ATP-binding cassette domain-containing protein [Actinomadura sp. 3N508]|uniref:ATP-binding cassette domain-containing protein n=1 Tax=Actinomadura sp. 3N508 TaxID=3375153 RepID=UPI00379E303E
METAILVEGLVKRFGAVTAVAGVDFAVARGSVLGLLGRNGAGKTTIVRVLATVLRPDAGRARVAGRDVARDAADVRRLIGLAGQSAAVDPNLTGAENLRLIGRLAQLPWKGARTRADELLDRFHLAEVAGRPVGTWSGGTRRRLDVAASLVHRPPVIFLDEPTTGLDLDSREDLWAMVRELVADGVTVLLTTQYLEEADRLADRIVVIDDGRVVADDTPAALKAQLGGTVIELGFPDEDSAAEAARTLAGAHPERDGPRLRITTRDGVRLLMDVLPRLDGQGLSPAALSVRDPSLDDVFLTVTGASR